jgi:hypothetical protein
MRIQIQEPEFRIQKFFSPSYIDKAPIPIQSLRRDAYRLPEGMSKPMRVFFDAIT